MHSMVTAKQYARHQGQFPNMGGVIYEIWHSSSSLIGSRHNSSESVPNSPSDKPYLFVAFSFPLTGIKHELGQYQDEFYELVYMSW